MSAARSTLALRLFAALTLTTAFTATAIVAVKPAEGGAAPPASSANAVKPLTTPAPGHSMPPTPVSPSQPGPMPPPQLILTVTSVQATSVTLSWTSPTAGCCGIVGYDVLYYRPFDDVLHRTQVGNVSTATIIGLSRTTQYTFSVSSLDSTGQRRHFSNSIIVVTPVSDTGPDTTPPQGLVDLTGTNTVPGFAELTWSPATDNVGVTGYEIYRFDGWYTSAHVATVSGTSYTVVLGSPANNFYVRARDAAGNLSRVSNLVRLIGSTAPPATPPTCRAVYKNTADWAGGFVATVTITNIGQATVTGWTLTFAFGGDQRISSAWAATSSQTGKAVTMRNLHWNRLIPVGGSTSVGMQGTFTTSNAAPTAISVNGLSCAIG
ncbi:MAG TPA: cellulose binding domain-containing protein [Micromonosporaceae bacterium]|nr:cellulose binding domain-containing protein [Micromonosporaceae bacterium]